MSSRKGICAAALLLFYIATARADDASGPAGVNTVMPLPSSTSFPPPSTTTAPTAPAEPATSQAPAKPETEAVIVPGTSGAYQRPAKRTRRKRERPLKEEYPVKIEADNLHKVTNGDVYEAHGHVVLRFEDVEIHGDRLMADLDAGVAKMPGDVEIRFQNQTVMGRDMTFYIDDRRWEVDDANTSITPDFFDPGAVAQNVLARAVDLRGDPDRVIGVRGRMTTCVFPDPHYSIRGRRMIIIPDQRAVIKHAAFKYKDKTFLTLPVYIIDLRRTAPARRRQSLIPQFGSNQFEGKFLKLAVPLYAALHNAGTGYLDLIEKRGVGFGAQNDYNYNRRDGSPKREGSFYSYILNERRTSSRQFDTRIQHTEHFSQTLTGTFRIDSTSNNQFQGPGTSILNFDSSLNRFTTSSNSALNLRREQFVSSFATSTNTNAAFSHSQTFSSFRSLDMNIDYRDTSGNAGFNNTELNTRLEFTNREKLLDIMLQSEIRQDLSGNRNPETTFLTGLDRRPEITLMTDSRKLGTQLFGKVPMSAGLSFGEFKELPGNTSLMRTHLLLRAENTSLRLSRWAELNLGGSFDQSLYSDSTARYIINHQTRFNIHPGKSTVFQLNYSKQRPVGFSPFRFDFANNYEAADGTLSIGIGRAKGRRNSPTGFGSLASFDPFSSGISGTPSKLRLNFSTGYDFTFNQYRDLIMRAQYLPTSSIYVSASSGYNPNTGDFRDAVGRIQIAPERGAFRFNAQARYSTMRNKLARLNHYTLIPIAQWWQLEWINGYNGFTRKSDFTQFRLRRELHDANLYLTYDHQSKELRFDFALKAFPAFDTRFGVGTQGQPLYGVGPGGEFFGAGVGEIF